jgi:hypothetical protein
VVTRRLLEGVKIIEERPLLGVGLNVSNMVDNLLNDFHMLDEKDKVKLLHLYDFKEPLEDNHSSAEFAAKLLRIVQVNSIRTVDGNCAGRLNVYPTASLLNHSCRPNLIWFPSQDHIVVRTVEVVEKGEELTISYLNTSLKDFERGHLCQTKTQRKVHLDKFLFQCKCAVCQVETEDEAFQRMEFQILDRDFEQRLEDNSPVDLMKIAFRKLEIAEDLKEHQATFISLVDCWKILEVLHSVDKDEEFIAESKQLRKRAEKLSGLLGPVAVEAFTKFDKMKLDSVMLGDSV